MPKHKNSGAGRGRAASKPEPGAGGGRRKSGRTRRSPERYAPPGQGGGGRAGAASAASKPEPGAASSPANRELLYKGKRVKSPGSMESSLFGSVESYNAELGWKVEYDKKNGKDLTEKEVVYVKDRKELVSMIDDCITCDKENRDTTFYEGLEVLTELEGGKTGLVRGKSKGGKWKVELEDGTTTRIPRATLVQQRGNYLLRHVYRVPYAPNGIITGRISRDNQLTRIPTEEAGDVSRGGETSRLMKHDDQTKSRSGPAKTQILGKLRSVTKTPKTTAIDAGPGVLTVAPGKDCGGIPVDGAIHQDDAYSGIGGTGDRPRTFAVLLWVKAKNRSDGGGVVYFLDSEGDMYTETDDPVKNRKIIEDAAFKYRTWTFGYEENAYVICDPDTWHYPEKYEGDSQCVKLNCSLVIGGKFDIKHNNKHLEPWMTEVQDWEPIEAVAGSKSARPRRSTRSSRTRKLTDTAGLKPTGLVPIAEDDDGDEDYMYNCRTNGRGGSRGCRADRWNARLNELRTYKNEHGHCNVPQDHGSLGWWVDKQRSRRNNLSKGRVRALNVIGFTWDPRESAWDRRLEELANYKNEHGHCNVPQDHGSLGRWVDKQRRKRNKLSKGRVKALDAIDFTWDARESAWDRRLEELANYKTEHGHCNVPKNHGALGTWVMHQRTTGSKLSEGRVRALDELGFTWKPRESAWNARFEELANYKREHGDCDVPSNHGTLYKWVNKQQKRKNKLSKGRVEALNELGFTWKL